MGVFSRFLERFTRKQFTVTRECFWCRGVATISTDSVYTLSEWSESLSRYHEECRPIGMCHRELLEHALLYRPK